jgi:hypothetical protein
MADVIPVSRLLIHVILLDFEFLTSFHVRYFSYSRMVDSFRNESSVSRDPYTWTHVQYLVEHALAAVIIMQL